MNTRQTGTTMMPSRCRAPCRRSRDHCDVSEPPASACAVLETVGRPSGSGPPRGLKPAAEWLLGPVRQATGGARSVATVIIVLAASAAAPAGAQETSKPEADDKQDLARELIREAQSESDDDLMAEIMRLMNAAAKRLEIDFDAGEETRAIQQQVLHQLDDAIKLAASQRRPASGRPQPCKGEKRRREDDPQRRGDRQADSNDRAGDAEESDTTPPGGQVEGGPTALGKLEESRRSWGHLPQREREEVIQGIQEKFIPRYREWIEQYYRALQEAGE